MYPHNFTEESILKSKPVYRGLAPSSSGFWSPHKNTNVTSNNHAPKNASVPFTASMIEPILAILDQCPTGEFGLRVFQQHDEQGTCWNDALYMILFNSDELKQAIRPIYYRLLTLNAAEGNLDFGKVGTTDVKLHRFAKALRAEFDPRGSIAVWELLTVNLQRYLQLAYLFMTDPSVKRAVAPSNLSYSRLATRRKSLQCNTYTKIHAFTKPSLTFETHGSHRSDQFINSVNKFLKSISPGGYTYMFKSNRGLINPDVSTIHGYYLVNFKHVVSLFKCGGRWILYDNELGSAECSPEDSAKLDANIVKNYGQECIRNSCTYTILLSNDETIQVQFDWKGTRDIHNKMNTNAEIHYLLKTPTGGAVAAGPASIIPRGMALGSIASGSNNNQDGGHKRSKTQRKRRRHARKKTRRHK